MSSVIALLPFVRSTKAMQGQRDEATYIRRVGESSNVWPELHSEGSRLERLAD